MIHYFFLLLLVLPITAYTQEIIFDHRSDNRDYLRYYSIWSRLQESAMLYQFGEVSVHQDSTTHHIHLSRFVHNVDQLQDIVTGVSTRIQDMARTQNFTLPASGTIRWFGKIGSCRPGPTTFDSTSRTVEVAPNRETQNRVEFVVQLVKTDGDSILATLDSLGAYSTEMETDIFYGESIHAVVHSVPVPPGHTNELVYIRVSPRRYGSTSSITISSHSLWVNRTAQYCKGTTPLQSEELQQLKDQWFTTLLAYCDSVKAETGWLPNVRHVEFFRRTEQKIFNQRYYNPRIDSSTGQIIWIEKFTLDTTAQEIARPLQSTSAVPGKEMPSQPIPSDNIRLSLDYFREMQIGQIRYSSIDMSLSIASLDETVARMRLISMQGKNMGQVWSGVIRSGRQIISVNTPSSISNGEYMLLLEKPTGEQLYQQSIVISRWQ